jgi:hypothetical protein
MYNEFDQLLEELDACREAREASGGEGPMVGRLHKSHLAPISYYEGHRGPDGEVTQTRRREWPQQLPQRAAEHRSRANLHRVLAELEQINKSMAASAKAARSATRTEQVATLKAEFAKARRLLDVAVRSGRMESLEVAKREARLNRLGIRVEQFTAARAA